MRKGVNRLHRVRNTALHLVIGISQLGLLTSLPGDLFFPIDQIIGLLSPIGGIRTPSLDV